MTDKEGNTETPPTLKYVRVITTTTAGGVDENEVEPNEDGTFDLPTTITMLITVAQAQELAGHLQQYKAGEERDGSPEHSPVLHFAGGLLHIGRSGRDVLCLRISSSTRSTCCSSMSTARTSCSRSGSASASTGRFVRVSRRMWMICFRATPREPCWRTPSSLSCSIRALPIVMSWRSSFRFPTTK